MNIKLESFTDWTSVSIEKRQEMLIGLAKDIWKVEKYEV
jgi:hypothetical protein